MITYKKFFSLLKEKKCTTYDIRKNNVISETTLQKMRKNEVITTASINKICEFLNCQPGDVMAYEERREKK